MDVLGFVKEFNGYSWNSFLMYALLGVGIFYTIYLASLRSATSIWR